MRNQALPCDVPPCREDLPNESRPFEEGGKIRVKDLMTIGSNTSYVMRLCQQLQTHGRYHVRIAICVWMSLALTP